MRFRPESTAWPKRSGSPERGPESSLYWPQFTHLIVSGRHFSPPGVPPAASTEPPAAVGGRIVEDSGEARGQSGPSIKVTFER